MGFPNSRSVGNAALWLSLLVFSAFFLNVLIGGPLGRKPWMSDVMEMLTLFAAVTLFVGGTIARERQEKNEASDSPEREAGRSEV